jgi:putative peptidoglycan lipid II flippase
MASSTIARASTLMAAGTTASRILGFVKAMVLATAIGVTASVGADSFAVGNMLPNSVYMVLIGGVLSAVLVPQIVQAMAGHDGGGAYVNKLVTIAMVFLLVITGLAMAFAPLLVKLYAMAWSPEQLALAVGFAYWCLPQIFFYGLFNILGEVLNAKKVFGPSSWAPVLNNIVAITGLVIYIVVFGADPDGNRELGDWHPAQIALLAGSATLGVIIQAVILSVAWRKAGIRYRPDFIWRGVGFSTLGKIAGWSLATVIVMQLGGIVTTNVASTASGQGASVAALQYAWLIFMLPYSILAFSIGTAYFTRLAEHARNNNSEDMRTDVSAALRVIGLVMTGSAAIIFITAPFIALVLMDGAKPADIAALAVVIMMYILSLTPYGMLFVIQRTYFAFNDTRTPFFFTVLQISLFVGGSLLVLAFSPVHLIAAMLALSFTIATIIQVTVGLIFLKRKIGGIDGKRVFVSHLKYAVAVVPTVGVGYGMLQLSATYFDTDELFLVILESIIYAGILGCVYLGTLWLLRSEEITELLSQVKAKIRKQ